MRRARPVVLAALGVVVVAELATRAIAGHIPQPREWSTPEIETKVEQIGGLAELGGADVVMLGSSVIDVAVDPGALDLPVRGRTSAYNAALGAGTIGMVDIWARHVVLPRLHPDVAVVGISSRDLNAHDPRQVETEEQFLVSQPVERALGTEGILDRTERLLEDLSYLVRYRTVLRNPRNLVRGDEPSADAPLTGPLGQFRDFLVRRYQPSARAKQFFLDGPLHDFEVGRDKVAALRRLLEALGRDGVRVVVVDVPVTDDYVAFHPAGYERYEQVMESLAADAGAELVDPGVWDDEFFADPLHVNAKGADRLAALLTETLRATGDTAAAEA